MNPRDIIWTIQLEVYCTMLHTKFGDPEPYGFWQADFLGFSLYKPLENKYLQYGGLYEPKVYNSTNLDWGSLGNATHKIWWL